MFTAIIWILIDIMWIATSIINKITYERQGRSSFGWGIVCGLNIACLAMWICKLCGLE